MEQASAADLVLCHFTGCETDAGGSPEAILTMPAQVRGLTIQEAALKERHALCRMRRMRPCAALARASWQTAPLSPCTLCRAWWRWSNTQSLRCAFLTAVTFYVSVISWVHLIGVQAPAKQLAMPQAVGLLLAGGCESSTGTEDDQ